MFLFLTSSCRLLPVLLQAKQAVSRRMHVQCVCACVCFARQRDTEHWVHGNTLRACVYVCVCVCLVTTLILSSVETGGKTQKLL